MQPAHTTSVTQQELVCFMFVCCWHCNVHLFNFAFYLGVFAALWTLLSQFACGHHDGSGEAVNRITYSGEVLLALRPLAVSDNLLYIPRSLQSRSLNSEVNRILFKKHQRKRGRRGGAQRRLRKYELRDRCRLPPLPTILLYNPFATRWMNWRRTPDGRLSSNSPKVILGDFNHCQLHKSLKTYEQYATSATTRKNSTIDLCCISVPGTFRSLPLPPFGAFYHNSVLPLLIYKPMYKLREQTVKHCEMLDRKQQCQLTNLLWLYRLGCCL